MKICHVAPELLPVPPTKGGAIERWIRDAAVRLARARPRVHVISRDHGDGATAMTIDGVHYHYVRIPPADRSRLAGGGAARACGTTRRAGALLAAHRAGRRASSQPARRALAEPRRRAAAARDLAAQHGIRLGLRLSRLGSAAVSAAGFDAAARVLCVSTSSARHTVERYPAHAAKAMTVYNGVDGELFTPGATVELERHR